ncbi:MAG: AAA family ATPase [Bermanella sp.]
MESTVGMSTILDEFRAFFGIQDMPFSLVPNTQYYVGIEGHNECFNMLMFAIASGDGFIKVTGEVGTGKTLLCRRLLNSLDENEFYSAYIPNPKLNAVELKRVLAQELGVKNTAQIKSQNLLEAINNRLMKLAQEGKKVVLIIDEAQAFPKDSLEELRLLSNLETETHKLMQIVLFGQPELDEVLSHHEFRQLRQRITFSHFLNRLNKNSTGQYIHHRMVVAGYIGEPVFDLSSIRLLYRATQGTPRLINIVCAKALLIAFSKGQQRVRKAMVRTAINDTEGLSKRFSWLIG